MSCCRSNLKAKTLSSHVVHDAKKESKRQKVQTESDPKIPFALVPAKACRVICGAILCFWYVYLRLYVWYLTAYTVGLQVIIVSRRGVLQLMTSSKTSRQENIMADCE